MLLLSLSGCFFLTTPNWRSDNPELPPITAEGVGRSLGMRLNDSVNWLPGSTNLITPAFRRFSNFADSTRVTINARKVIKEEPVEELWLRVDLSGLATDSFRPVWVLGQTYPLFDERTSDSTMIEASASFSIPNPETPDRLTLSFGTDTLRRGSLTVTGFSFLPDCTFFAGTFEFEGINRQTGRIIRVTEGRFDVRMR